MSKSTVHVIRAIDEKVGVERFTDRGSINRFYTNVSESSLQRVADLRTSYQCEITDTFEIHNASPRMDRGEYGRIFPNSNGW